VAASIRPDSSSRPANFSRPGCVHHAAVDARPCQKEIDSLLFHIAATARRSSLPAQLEPIPPCLEVIFRRPAVPEELRPFCHWRRVREVATRCSTCVSLSKSATHCRIGALQRISVPVPYFDRRSGCPPHPAPRPGPSSTVLASKNRESWRQGDNWKHRSSVCRRHPTSRNVTAGEDGTPGRPGSHQLEACRRRDCEQEVGRGIGYCPSSPRNCYVKIDEAPSPSTSPNAAASDRACLLGESVRPVFEAQLSELR